MKKGYKKCPFCANEVKEGAIKCPFCEEFLDGRDLDKSVQGNRSDSLKIDSKKKYGFLGRFFRKDLNLNKKRWHRLLKGVFVMILIGIPCYFYITDGDLKDDISYAFSYHERISDLNSRFPDSDGFRNPLYLKEDGERIRNGYSKNEKYEIIPDKPKYTNGQDLLFESYCSPKLSKNFDSICEKTGIHSYYSLFNGYITLLQAKQEINNYNITCLNIVHDHFVPEEYGIFYYRKTSGSILYGIGICLWGVFKYLLISIGIGIVLMIIYYKVVIYSIYGNSNKM